MSLSLKQIAKDVALFAGSAVAVLTIVENLAPSLHAPVAVQSIVAAAITLLTALLSVTKQNAVAAAVAPVTPAAKPLDKPVSTG